MEPNKIKILSDDNIVLKEMDIKEFMDKYEFVYCNGAKIKDYKFSKAGSSNYFYTSIDTKNYIIGNRLNEYNFIILTSALRDGQFYIYKSFLENNSSNEVNLRIILNSKYEIGIDKEFQFSFNLAKNYMGVGHHFIYGFSTGNYYYFMHKEFDNTNLKKSFIDHMNECKVTNNLFAIEKHNCKNSLSLEVLGFKKIHSFVNPNTNNLLNYYEYDFGTV